MNYYEMKSTAALFYFYMLYNKAADESMDDVVERMFFEIEHSYDPDETVIPLLKCVRAVALLLCYNGTGFILADCHIDRLSVLIQEYEGHLLNDTDYESYKEDRSRAIEYLDWCREKRSNSQAK